MQQACSHPLAGPGCLVEPKRQETHSKRLFVARLEGQSAWARIHPIEIYMTEARNRIRGINGETEETTEEVSSPLLVYYQSLGSNLLSTRVNYVLCGFFFYSIEY